MRTLSVVISVLLLPHMSPAAEESELVARVQVFLDQSPFKPGKIDGLWGGFTEQALAQYQKANGKGEVTFDGKDSSKLPFDPTEVSPVFTEYTITKADEKMVGDLPEDGEVEKKAEMERLPYAGLRELVAEKYHVDIDYLGTLNPDAKFAVGDTVRVPNVKTPFLLGSVEEAKEAEEAEEAEKSEEAENGNEEKEEPDDVEVKIRTATKLLEFYQGGELAGTYPVSTGSESVPAPEGDWEITSITYLPTFRWDKKMLEEGVRSTDSHLLPPGVNSPVGIVWMAIDSDGIGIHGTDHPDTIGHADSHGCIRLSNWDAWELSQKLAPGVPVTIE